VLVVGAGAFIITRVRRRSRDAATPTAPDRLTQKQLDQRAGSLLVQLDDSLKTSEQELGFAVAQFGDDATKDFTAALASAKAKVAQAFTLKQQLSDGEPETDDQKRDLTTQIIQLCEAADAELDAQADAFDDLRQLEKNAPDALVAVRAAISAATTRSTSAEKALDELKKSYSASAARPVADNVTQAAKLLAFAGTGTDAADKALAAGKPADAAIAVRGAQQAVGQATAVFDAIDKLSADLGDAGG
jgi:flagellin-like hook-associated protein FlgL